MVRKILIIGIPARSHYNEVLSGILMGYLVAKNMGEMTYIGSLREGALPSPRIIRITLSSFPWESLADYDVIVVVGKSGEYQVNGSGERFQLTYPPHPNNMTEAQCKAITEFVRKGKSCVAIHTAASPLNKEFNDMIGGHFIHHPHIQEFTIEVEDPSHPITQGIKPFKTVDELFFYEIYDPSSIHVLLRSAGEIVHTQAAYEGKTSPQAWVKSYGKGRIVCIAPGHDIRTYLNPLYLRLVERSILWATHNI